MLQWILRFSEFTEFIKFNESSAPFRKIANKSSIYKLENVHASLMPPKHVYLKKKDGGATL